MLVAVGFLFLTSRNIYPEISTLPSTTFLASPEYASVIVRSNNMAQEYAATANLPGMTIAVAKASAIIWSAAYGFEDIALQVPMSHKTKMRIGSISKAMTSIGLGVLIDKGAIDVDQYVNNYFPDFPEKKHNISIRILGGHMGGIRHYRTWDKWIERAWNEHYTSLGDGLEKFQDDPLLFVPGTYFHYSSFGYNLLGVIMEQVADTSFPAFIREAVFDPLGMKDTEMDDISNYPIPHKATYYRINTFGKVRPAVEVDVSYKWPSGGMLSTSEDLMRLAMGIFSDSLISTDTQLTLFSSQLTASKIPTGYGIGWMIKADPPNNVFIYHTGSVEGGAGILILNPTHQLALAINTNIDMEGAQGLSALGFQLLTLFLSAS